MKVLVACEESQEVCKAFRERGHDIFSEPVTTYAKLAIAALEKEIDKAPTVDAVPVVRCKDCKYFKTRLCENEDNYDDWFCADGERKENE